MITDKQMEQWRQQNTEKGRMILNIKEGMKKEYISRLHIPSLDIKIGKLVPLVDSKTGKITRFIEQ